MAAPKPHVTIAKVRQAAEETGGVISEMARLLGTSRQTIYHRLRTDPELAAFHQDQREVFIDEAESGLLRLVREGNVAAIIFTLKTLGRHRGWVEQPASAPAAATGQVVIMLPDNGRGPTKTVTAQDGS